MLLELEGYGLFTEEQVKEIKQGEFNNAVWFLLKNEDQKTRIAELLNIGIEFEIDLGLKSGANGNIATLKYYNPK